MTRITKSHRGVISNPGIPGEKSATLQRDFSPDTRRNDSCPKVEMTVAGRLFFYRRCLNIFSASLLSLVFVLLAGTGASAQFAGGDGSQGDPYQIANVTQLQAIRNASNTAYYKLINNIDATATAGWNGGAGFEPIGWFGGSLDGNNFSITGLVINRPGTYQTAIFTQSGLTAVFKDLTLNNIQVIGGARTGALAGTLGGLVQNVTVSGAIQGSNLTGGIAGQSDSGSSIVNSSFSGSITGTGDDIGGITGYSNNGILENNTFTGSVTGGSRVGGVTGKNQGPITNCHSSATVTGSGIEVGGLVGHNNDAAISESGSSGTVNGQERTGGLIGFNGWGNSLVINCQSSADVNGTSMVGGLIGLNQDGRIENTYSSGTVSASSQAGGLIGVNRYGASVIIYSFSSSDVIGSNNQIGGLVGEFNQGTLENCYATGDVNGNNRVGGLIGQLTDGTISNAFSAGSVVGGGGQTGGLIGRIQSGTVADSFWDTDTSGMNSSAGGTPRSTEQMKTLSNFTSAGWDFDNTWGMLPGINDGYPHLFFQNVVIAYDWTGAVDREWENPDNWSSSAVPVAGSQVTIPDVSNQPVISSAIAITDLTIAAGSSVTIAPVGSLTVSGALTNHAGASGLVIRSNASGSGSLIHNSAVTGRFQRFFEGTALTWHILSSPMASQAISPDFTPPGSYGDGTGYDLYHWHEPDSGWAYFNHPAAWSASHGSVNFHPGRGYMVSYQEENPVKTFFGAFNYGAVQFPVTNTFAVGPDYAGANLAGNPYPSSIDWKADAGWERSSLTMNGGGYDVWIWSNLAANYGVYNSASQSDLGTLGVTRYISPTQGFFVNASQSGTLEMSNAVRVHNGAGIWIKSAGMEYGTIRLRLVSENGTGYDEALIGFGHPVDEPGISKRFSFVPTAPSLYIPIMGKDYSIRLFGEKTDYPVIPLAFRAGADGDYTLAVIFNPHEFDLLELYDRKTGLKHNLKSQTAYRFTASVNDRPDRFVLQFAEGSYADPFEPLPVRVYTQRHSITFDMRMIEGESVTEIFSMNGQKLFRSDMRGGMVHPVAWYRSGLFIVRITGSRGVFVQKVTVAE